MRRSHIAAWFVALCAVAFAVYGRAFDNPFVYDDHHAIVANEFVKDSRHLGRLFRGDPTSTGTFQGHVRPLTYTTYFMNFALGGLAPAGYRAVDLTLHLVCALLAFVVLRRLLTAFSLTRSTSLTAAQVDLAALAAVTFFVVHPINSLPMLLVLKRATLLSAAFCLVAVLAFMRIRGLGGRPATRTSARILLTSAVFLGFVLGVASKETAVTLPPILLLLELWPNAAAPAWSRARVFRVALFHAPLWVGVVLQLTLLYPAPLEGAHVYDRASYLFTQAKVIWLYVAMLAAPGLIAAAYDVPLSTSLADPAVVAGGGAIVALIVVAVRFARRFPLPGFALFWALISLSPTSSIDPNALIVDEDRAYVAFIAVWAVVGVALVLALRHRLAIKVGAVVLFVALTLGFLAATAERCDVWRTGLSVWRDAISKYPRAGKAVANECMTLVGLRERADEAVLACQRALEITHQDPAVVSGLVTSLMRLGRRDEARQAVRRGLEIFPTAPPVLAVAGHVAWFLGDPRAAIPYYREVVRRDQWDVDSRVYLAKSLQELGQLDQVQPLLEQIESRGVVDPQTRSTLVDLYVALKRFDDAKRHARASDDLIVQVARALLRDGRRDEACAAFQGALSAAPSAKTRELLAACSSTTR